MCQHGRFISQAHIISCEVTSLIQKSRSVITLMIASFAMFTMILDAKTAFSGAYEGLELCINVVIPSLFPFMILSMTLTTLISKLPSTSSNPIAPKSCYLSIQGSKIYLLGLLGGYPVGAQCVAQAYEAGTIRRSEAERMLAFSNNAGPAFIFGIGLRILDQNWMCWTVWLIHILASLITHLITPSMEFEEREYLPTKLQQLSKPVIQRCISVMASVCSWIVTFRVILAFLQKWFLWLLPKSIAVLICGILELSNGSIELVSLPSAPLRLILFSTMLGFGGLCVMRQTKAVLENSGLSGSLSFPGKIVHASISYLLSLFVTTFAFPEKLSSSYVYLAIVAIIICIGYRISYLKRKFGMDFSEDSLYNDKKSGRLYL